ncbi:hypothetical protein SDC9_151756 [bioreactor metagenome]|uniref:Uncharacterized protein n=1 Tax=bioreactor metagenome TaxID=1076179 RepID=A0A645ER49_9ZZZZ
MIIMCISIIVINKKIRVMTSKLNESTSYNKIFAQGFTRASLWGNVHHIPSLGAKLHHEVYLWGPAQGRRKYGTLYNMGGKRPSRPTMDSIKQVYRATVMRICRIMCSKDYI